MAIWFWIVMLLWILAGFGWGWSGDAQGRPWRFGFWILPLILFAMVGWKLFGGPVQ